MNLGILARARGSRGPVGPHECSGRAPSLLGNDNRLAHALVLDEVPDDRDLVAHLEGREIARGNGAALRLAEVVGVAVVQSYGQGRGVDRRDRARRLIGVGGCAEPESEGRGECKGLPVHDVHSSMCLPRRVQLLVFCP